MGQKSKLHFRQDPGESLLSWQTKRKFSGQDSPLIVDFANILHYLHESLFATTAMYFRLFI